MLVRLVVPVVGLLLVAAWSLPAAAQRHRPQHGGNDSMDAEARALFEAGRVAYDDGRFADALTYFRRAYDLSHRAELLYNVGSAADKLRFDHDALEAFRQYLRELPDASNRREVEARVAVLERAGGANATTTTGTGTTTTGTGTTTTTGTGTALTTGTGTTTTGTGTTTTTGTGTATTTGAGTGTGTGETHPDLHVTHDITPHHDVVPDLDHRRPVQHDDGGVAGQWWFWTLIGVAVAGAAAAIIVVLASQPANSTDGLVNGTDGVVHFALEAPR